MTLLLDNQFAASLIQMILQHPEMMAETILHITTGEKGSGQGFVYETRFHKMKWFTF